MPFLELVAISIALSMDALAVSVSTGVALKRPTLRQFFRMPFAFGLFQAIMPLTGWLLGTSVRSFIEEWDHWVACILLVFVGAKLMYETWRGDAEDEGKHPDPTKGWTIILLAVATSIDALAVGFSFALLSRPIIIPSLVIGLVCALISLGGMIVGSCVGRIETVRHWSGYAGSCALFAIALLILHEHGVF